jgi:glycosyltransferase involved in cell wall biosynthesis
MNNNIPSVSVIIPVKNEEGTIEKIVNNLPDLGSKTEIIFVESYSTDKSLEKIKNVADTYRGSKNLKWCSIDYGNKSDAVWKGFEMASGDILMIYDADMTVPIEETRYFLDALSIGPGSLAIGTRFVNKMEKGAMGIKNIFANKLYAKVWSWIARQKITDSLCGTKALWKTDYEKMSESVKFTATKDPFGDFDLMLGAIDLGLKIVEIPVHYKARIYGKTNIRAWRDGWSLLKILFGLMIAGYCRKPEVREAKGIPS